MFGETALNEVKLSHAAYEAEEISRRDRLNVYIMLVQQGFKVCAHDEQSGIEMEQMVSYEAAKATANNELVRVIESVAFKIRNARADFNRTRAIR